VDRFEWNKGQNVRKRVKFKAETELSVWGAIKGEKPSQYGLLACSSE